MNRRFIVHPWAESKLQEVRYDALVVALGYERRARFVAETLHLKSTEFSNE